MAEQIKIKLQTSDDGLIWQFRNLTSFYDIAILLEIDPKFLHSILFKRKTYYPFKIPKKNGYFREIKTPNKNLRIIQRKLNYIISLNYFINKSAHGFIKGKSILTNANPHVNQKYVLNFDLKDYFHQFNQGRLIGFFKKYYKFTDTVAGTLTNICCFNNVLPQGAPTSPVISNILSFELDKELYKLCKQKNCTYSRYVDDITISTNNNHFPNDLAYMEGIETKIGEKLEGLVRRTGFEINYSKNRLRNDRQHQSVTGITVNEKPNLNRNYIKRIRAILHNFKVNDIDTAEKIFYRHHHPRHRKHDSKVNMYNVVKGMIEFVGQIKGRDNRIYRKLAMSFNKLSLPRYISPIDYLTQIEKTEERIALLLT